MTSGGGGEYVRSSEGKGGGAERSNHLQVGAVSSENEPARQNPTIPGPLSVWEGLTINRLLVCAHVTIF